MDRAKSKNLYMVDVPGNDKRDSSTTPAVKNAESEYPAMTGFSDEREPDGAKSVGGGPLVTSDGEGHDSHKKGMEEGLLSESNGRKTKGKRPRSCCCVFMVICGVQVGIIALLGLLVLILYLVYKPKAPQVFLDAEKGQPFSASYFDVENQTLITNARELFFKMLENKEALMNITGQIDYTVTIVNPNKFDLHSEGSNLIASFQQTTFVTSTIDRFSVPAKDRSNVRSNAAINIQVTSAVAMEFLAAALGGEIVITTVFTQAAKIKILGIVSPKVTIAVQCLLTFTVEDRELKNKVCSVLSLKIG